MFSFVPLTAFPHLYCRYDSEGNEDTEYIWGSDVQCTLSEFRHMSDLLNGCRSAYNGYRLDRVYEPREMVDYIFEYYADLRELGKGDVEIDIEITDVFTTGWPLQQ